MNSKYAESAVCGNCKTEFSLAGKSNKGTRRFCSRACGWAGRATRERRYHHRKVSKMGANANRRIYGDCCLICSWDRCLDYAHIIPASEGGTIHPSNIIPLCPNHHRLFDQKMLNDAELAKIQHRLPGLSGQASYHPQ